MILSRDQQTELRTSDHEDDSLERDEQAYTTKDLVTPNPDTIVTR